MVIIYLIVMKTTVRILVEQLAGYHTDLECYYRELEKGASNTRVAALLNFLVRSEQSQLQFFEVFINQTIRTILDSELCISTETKELPGLFYYKGDRHLPVTTCSDVMSIALRNETQLINYCSLLSKTEGNDYLVPVFNRICKEFSRERRNLLSYNYLFAS